MNENEEKETINVDVSDVVDHGPTVTEKVKKTVKANKVVFFLTQFAFIIALILYITLSLTARGPFGPYNLNGWALWWIFFLIVPTLPLIYKSIASFKFNLFPIDGLVVISYLLVGLLTGLWHPYWALLFIAPVYHILCSNIKKFREHK